MNKVRDEMNKLYVIAGTFDEYARFRLKCKEINRYENHTLTFLSSSDLLRGLINPPGIFIGTWYIRDDIEKILMTLLLVSQNNSQPEFTKRIEALDKAWKVLNIGKK